MLRAMVLAVAVLCGCSEPGEVGPDAASLRSDNLDVKLGASCTSDGTFCAEYRGVCTASPAVCRGQCTEGPVRCAMGAHPATVPLLDGTTPGCVCLPD